MSAALIWSLFQHNRTAVTGVITVSRKEVHDPYMCQNIFFLASLLYSASMHALPLAFYHPGLVNSLHLILEIIHFGNISHDFFVICLTFVFS